MDLREHIRTCKQHSAIILHSHSSKSNRISLHFRSSKEKDERHDKPAKDGLERQPPTTALNAERHNFNEISF